MTVDLVSSSPPLIALYGFAFFSSPTENSTTTVRLRDGFASVPCCLRFVGDGVPCGWFRCVEIRLFELLVRRLELLWTGCYVSLWGFDNGLDVCRMCDDVRFVTLLIVIRESCFDIGLWEGLVRQQLAVCLIVRLFWLLKICAFLVMNCHVFAGKLCVNVCRFGWWTRLCNGVLQVFWWIFDPLNVCFTGSIYSVRILAKVCWRSAENWWLGEGNKQMLLL